MKKFVSLSAVVLLVTMLFPISAFAHGHSGNSNASTNYAICSVSGCTLTTTHEHDGVTCFPHTTNDGHSYHSSNHKSRGKHH